jgi:tRNA threonylcarbamoyladenosine biosynthesis protein TsaE
VLLEGPLGAGKTTFAKALLESMSVIQPPEGSPSFAIAHEYHSPRGAVIHLDLYRLKSEAELEDAGIPDYFARADSIVLCEWLSAFPLFREGVLREDRVFEVRLSFVNLVPGSESLRSVEILTRP